MNRGARPGIELTDPCITIAAKPRELSNIRFRAVNGPQLPPERETGSWLVGDSAERQKDKRNTYNFGIAATPTLPPLPVSPSGGRDGRLIN